MRLRFWRRHRRPLDLAPYVGQWVGIKDGHVIAHAPTVRDLMGQITAMGSTGRGSTMFFHRDPAERAWLVRWPHRPSGPNDRFTDRPEAERWAASWQPNGTVVEDLRVGSDHD